MKTFLKILVLLLLVVSIASVVFFTLNKEKIHQAIRIRIEKELTNLIKHPVSIDSVEFLPFNTVLLNNISITSPLSHEKIIANAQNVTLSLDLIDLIKNKQLSATIIFKDIRAEDTLSSVSAKILSKKSDTYLNVFNASLINSVFIINGKVAMKNIIFQNICGNIEINDLSLSKGKIATSVNGQKYLLDFSLNNYDTTTYEVDLTSNNLDLAIILTKDDNLLTVESLTGTAFMSTLDLKGTLQDYLSSDLKYKFNGHIEIDLEKMSILPGKAGEITSKYPSYGTIKSNVFIESESLSPWNCTGTVTLAGNNLKLSNLKISEINSKIYLDHGRINAPLINGVIYEGDFSSDFKIDLLEKNMPYLFSFTVNSLNFGDLLRDLTSSSMPVYGTLESDLSLSGFMKVPKSFKGAGELSITGADLGPMPILTPLLGNIFSAVSNIIPGANMVMIDQAHANLYIGNEKIMTDNLLLQGDDISITGTGYVGFTGELNFDFQNEFKPPTPEQEESWQTTIRNAIINVGKAISKARLRGTIGKPKWEMKYFDPIKKNIKNLLDISQ